MKNSLTSFDLDFAQRVYFGHYGDPTTFSEESVAAILCEIAGKAELDGRSSMFLASLARAFADPDARWKVALGGRGKGRKSSFEVTRDQLLEDQRIAAFMVDRAQGMKREAAIAEAVQHFGISRSAVFASLKREREMSPAMRVFAESLVD